MSGKPKRAWKRSWAASSLPILSADTSRRMQVALGSSARGPIINPYVKTADLDLEVHDLADGVLVAQSDPVQQAPTMAGSG